MDVVVDLAVRANSVVKMGVSEKANPTAEADKGANTSLGVVVWLS